VGPQSGRQGGRQGTGAAGRTGADHAGAHYARFAEADERELDAVRLAFVIASRRAGLQGPVDGVTVNLQHTEQLESDTQRSKRFGFTGKLCIHPNQVATVNAALSPTPAQVEWAHWVLGAASEQQAGTFQFEGAMVDAPVLARARSYLQASF